MKVYIYHCPDAPEHHRYVGRMLVPGAARGADKPGFLPVIASADTAERAEEKLRAIWNKDGEVKLRKRGQLQSAELNDEYAAAGLDDDGPIPGDKGARPAAAPAVILDDDLDGLLG